MIILGSTSDKIQLVTAQAADIEVHSSWIDNNAGSITPGRTNPASITTATTTDIIGSPAASTFRAVKYLSAMNNHATDSSSIQILHTDGTNVTELYNTTLLAGESVAFIDGTGFKRYTSGGFEATSAPPAAADIQVFATAGSKSWVKPVSFTPKVVIVEIIGG